MPARTIRGVTDRRAWGSLQRAQIVAAALDIARAEGIEALTIRRLAAEVGASRMALYRHVAIAASALVLTAALPRRAPAPLPTDTQDMSGYVDRAQRVVQSFQSGGSAFASTWARWSRGRKL
ncbi:TetR/AcrR family transcriptional regulator [Nocardia blacklockiae]|uniref:TetR/AcrR family transcriptional regulator n=1 Tax=Nocardia blacklockiae TaxID=480036 RepID=UPI001894807D|nr:TetR family transcriptional regulator [Nocardia blacklockiae]MBF6171537.1 TetR family transcriptional regulator [Nocardia blacklockiae]